MGEGTASDITAAQRHIIERPRLTRLLDQTEARVVMLVAPAGYGKTTLAQQWLRDKPHVWYRGRAESADVAALASGLASRVADVVGRPPERVIERAAAAPRPDADAEVLANLLADDLEGWPDDAWLAIDDYQFLGASPSAEAFIHALIDARGDLHVLVTTRKRPTWATPRRLLYGHVYEIGTAALAMTEEEAAETVSRREREPRPGLVALAHGWPAVIGLAAMGAELAAPPDDVPDSLYEYLAAELLNAAPPRLRRALPCLALTPTLDRRVAHALLGSSAPKLIDAAVDAGFLGRDVHGDVAMHPLLRRLVAKVERIDKYVSVPDAVACLAAYDYWDEAMSLIQRTIRLDLLPDLFENALAPLLDSRRLGTLNRWVQWARAHDVSHPAIDLGEAEIAFRDGMYGRAQALAHHVARARGASPKLRSSAWLRAAQSAHFADREAEALSLFQRAKRDAQTDDERREAAWGEFITALDLEYSGALQAFDEYRRIAGDLPKDVIRSASGEALIARRFGRGTVSVDDFQPLRHIAALAPPLVYIGFLNALATLLLLRAEFSEAAVVASDEQKLINDYSLDFLLPHARLLAASASVGLREFKSTIRVLNELETWATQREDLHILVNAKALRARLLLAEGDVEDAVRATEPITGRPPAPGTFGEYIACGALARACAREFEPALSLADAATTVTFQSEAEVLAQSARAVVSLEKGERGALAVSSAAFDLARQTGNYADFVAACRAHPPLLAAVATPERLDLLRELLTRSRDKDLAGGVGIRIPDQRPTKGRLSRREKEVCDLLVHGLANKEIARVLCISEVTVKVHVRSIRAKLGARSRTEAAVIALRDAESQPAAANKNGAAASS